MCQPLAQYRHERWFAPLAGEGSLSLLGWVRQLEVMTTQPPATELATTRPKRMISSSIAHLTVDIIMSLFGCHHSNASLFGMISDHSWLLLMLKLSHHVFDPDTVVGTCVCVCLRRPWCPSTSFNVPDKLEKSAQILSMFIELQKINLQPKTTSEWDSTISYLSPESPVMNTIQIVLRGNYLNRTFWPGRFKYILNRFSW